MAKRNFDLAAAIAGKVSESNTGAPEVKMIPIEDIIPNPANFYKIDKDALKSLMDSIAMDGLHHYPLVMKHPKEEGKWQLIDGERRYTACKELVQEGHEEFSTIPCTVKEYSSTALAELQLILSNSTSRVLSNAELSRQAEKTEMLFYQLKEEGYEFPGRMRDQVAAACNVSATKLAKLKVIREKLIADFMYLFEKDKLTEQAAYALARMPVELQNRIAEIRKGVPLDGVKAEQIQKLNADGCQWDAKDLKCPDGKACGGGNRFLRRDLEAQSWQGVCKGKKCCLTCDMATSSYNPCERMCSKAQKQRSDRKAKSDAKAAKEAARRAIPHQQKTQVNAQRILKAIDAAGLSDECLIPWRYSSVPVSTIRKWADGDFIEGKTWHEAELEPGRLSYAMDACKILKCSADFLLGLTDELHHGGGFELKWRSPMNPPEGEGRYVARFRIEGMDEPVVRLVYWKNFGWQFGNKPGAAGIDAECIGWWPIPGEDETDEKGVGDCTLCKSAHPGCDGCCDACEDHCNAWQSCRK